MKILIVEDEEALAKDIVNYLSSEDYRCELASNVEMAIDKLAAFAYDCILLDMMLPDGDGMEILEFLKKHNRTESIIIISAKTSVSDKVMALKTGADDYLAKPFHLSELAARIFSVIRRAQFDQSNQLDVQGLKIDLLSKTVSYNSKVLSLTKKEYELLLFFIGNKNKVISKSAIAETLSGDIADMYDSHDFIYAHIKNLKRKLKDAGLPSAISTAYGNGYKWEL